VAISTSRKKQHTPTCRLNQKNILGMLETPLRGTYPSRTYRAYGQRQRRGHNLLNGSAN